MIEIKQSGSFKHIEKLLDVILGDTLTSNLKKYGEMGLQALEQATPKDSGLTASSWSYIIEKGKDRSRIIWTNSNVVDGVQIALVLQYGHATRNGGYVEGIDYINPALKPLFKSFADSAWEEITKT